MFPVNKQRLRAIASMLFPVLCAGCINLAPFRTWGWRGGTPQQLSPIQRSLKYGPPAARGTATDGSPRPDDAVDSPVFDLPASPSPGENGTPKHPMPAAPPDAVQPNDTPEPVETPRGPTMLPRGVEVPLSLQLSVKAPTRKQVGTHLTYQITIRNTGDEPVDKVIVESEFDEALMFPGRPEKMARQSLGRLLPGQSKVVPLTLVAARAGRHCCRFTVSVNNVEVVSKSVCVEFRQKQLALSVLGPSSRTVGSRAEFTVNLVNISDRGLHRVQANITFDDALQPKEASAGVRQESGSLSWNLGDLKPSESVSLQAEFACLRPLDRCCLAIEIEGGNFPLERSQTCLQVESVQGALDLQVGDTVDPVAVGHETAFVVTLQNRPPNFIVIFVDNLGYGDIGPFGSKVHRTPRLDRMAAEGMKFTHFYVSAGVCTPSRASLMTGCYAQRVGLGFTEPDGIVLRPVSPNGLHPNEITIAEILKQQGYATTIIGKWHLGDQPPFLPTRQGFDSYFGIPYSDDMTADKRPPGQWPPLPLMENERVKEAPVDRNLLTRRYTQRALSYIAANKDRPFFLYLPQAMPGSTKAPFASEAFRGKSANGPWGDSVEELDWSTGQILDKLRDLGIEKQTLVIWTSDNGAPTSRKPEDFSRGSNRPLYGRGYTTAEGAFRVPTIFWWPGTVPAGRVCQKMATTMDILPTLAYLAGTKPPKDRVIDGKDIRPLLRGEEGATSPHKVFYYYSGSQLQAVRSGPWKLFVPLKNPQRHPHHRGRRPSPALLFNVVEDIGCGQNVADRHPDIVRRLTQLAEQGRAELGDLGRPGTGQRPVGRCENPTPRVLPSQRKRETQKVSD